jgi:hypothetical protein
MDIYCAYCGFSRGDLVGTSAESAYFRVVDATQKSESYDEFERRRKDARKRGVNLREAPLKKYFCTAQCYADSFFVTDCARAVGVDPDSIRADVRNLFASDPLVQKRMVASAERYEQITHAVRNSPAFIEFVRREQVDPDETVERAAAHEEILLAAQVGEDAVASRD